MNDETPKPLPPLKLHWHMRQVTRCQADSDDECDYSECPQLRDNEPRATGRHCPLDKCEDEDGPQ